METKYTHKLYYIASPYTALGFSDKEKSKVMTKRFKEVSDVTIELLNKGLYIFSPIAYNHPITRFNLPTDWGFWEGFDKSFLERCSPILLVLTLPGWDKSVGVKAEIEFAIGLGFEVLYLDYNEVMAGTSKEVEYLVQKTKG